MPGRARSVRRRSAEEDIAEFYAGSDRRVRVDAAPRAEPRDQRRALLQICVGNTPTKPRVPRMVWCAAMDVDTQIKQTVDALTNAWNAHDAAAFAALFHDDADFTNVMGMTANGREGVERFHSTLFATIFRHSYFRAEAVRIRLIRPDVAIIDIHWGMTGAEDRNRRPWPD